MPSLNNPVGKGERTPCAPRQVLLFLSVSCVLLVGAGSLCDYFHHAFLRAFDMNAEGSVVPPACRPASITVSVATSIINAFAQVAVLPALQAESNTAVIPAHEDHQVWVDQMILHHFKMSSLSAKTATPDSQSVSVSARDFGLEVNTTRFRYTYSGIHCYGHFSATLNSTDIDTVVSVALLPENRWNATCTEFKFKWGTLTIQHALDSKACGIAEWIVELFTGQLDTFIAMKIQKKLEEDGKNRATDVLNSLFAKVPILALTPPIMTTERLSAVLDATSQPIGCPPQHPVTDLPPLLPRDIAAHVTALDMNNALYNAATHGTLRWYEYLPSTLNTSVFSDVLPAVYEVCPDCPMLAEVRTATQPVVAFLPANTVAFTVHDLIVGLYIVPQNETLWSAAHALHIKQASKNRQKFESVYRRLGFNCSSEDSLYADVPIVALSCGATFGARNFTFENGRALHYEVMRVDNFDVDVVASLIGDVNKVEIQEKGMKVWNEVVVPLVNAESPLKLPFFLRKALLSMTLEKADFGVNVGLMNEFVPFLEGNYDY